MAERIMIMAINIYFPWQRSAASRILAMALSVKIQPSKGAGSLALILAVRASGITVTFGVQDAVNARLHSTNIAVNKILPALFDVFISFRLCPMRLGRRPLFEKKQRPRKQSADDG
ncbi:MAG: hypothetical protein WC750_06300 [Patescibacteria group bacterium]|jgi:hypothetical protein